MSLLESLKEVGLYLPCKQSAKIAGMLLETGGELEDENDRKVCVLVEHLGHVGFDDVRNGGHDYYGMSTYCVGNELYAVANDDEANAALDDALENYLNDCVEGANGPYFDRAAWKRDACYEDRGLWLAPYDGNEEEGREFFIYRLG